MLFQVTIPIQTNLDPNTILNLGSYISNIIGVVLTVAAVAALIYLIWGGLSWIFAGGEEKKIEQARDRITGAIIGLAVVAVSWAVFLVLDYFFGIGIAGSSGSNSTNGSRSSSSGVCLYPTSRCCSDVNNSACYCQNPNYTSQTLGTCNAGGGYTGVLCQCAPR